MRQLKNDTKLSNQIYHADSKFGPVRVYQNKDYRWLTFNNDPPLGSTLQGVMSKARPELLCVPIYQSMLLFLLAPVSELRILNLGLGTAAIERALKHIESSRRNLIDTFESVEINPDVISIAKQFFKLPSDHTVHQQCAQQFISQCTQQYDLIYIDIFSGEHHQTFIQSESFWHAINHCINKSGQAIINLNSKTGQELQTTLVLLRHYFNCIALIEFNEYKNIVLILSNLSLKHITVEAIQASTVMQSIAPNLHSNINTIYHIEAK
ncbi:hypothetical protein I6E78_13840 [Pseudoalteromonas sp. NZS127]|uniref:spermidine synthase n=1 Tax=Pseudoalteromonas TaxID=53246 RepID=UPI0018CD66DC|nr:hypothetical protein [Pseudoalteromonas sp. NZS127]MBH0073054.1 hypothetical protein [Pseudoalteromonas sp. NZS127]|tara:strand:- start:2113 stop:2910 length:798 start_codon:yes stop_codon:yes gene_type:complete